MSEADEILPDLQGSLVCEDVRMEAAGSQTLVGVVNAIFAPQLPVSAIKLCIWTRWCSGVGTFQQRTRILAPDESEALCENELQFHLANIEAHATNVNFFSGLQFREYGVYHAEVFLGDQLRLRYPLVVAQPSPS